MIFFKLNNIWRSYRQKPRSGNVCDLHWSIHRVNCATLYYAEKLLSTRNHGKASNIIGNSRNTPSFSGHV